MLQREERVRTRGMKAPVIRSVRFAFGSIKFLDLPPPRGAVVVSKRVLSAAPLRNRLRRRIAAILRELIRTGRIRASVIVYPDRTALTAPAGELQAALEQVLRVR